MKYKLKNTGEIVDAIGCKCLYSNSKDLNDYVHYVDNKGVSHKENLNIFLDLISLEHIELLDNINLIDVNELVVAEPRIRIYLRQYLRKLYPGIVKEDHSNENSIYTIDIDGIDEQSVKTLLTILNLLGTDTLCYNNKINTPRIIIYNGKILKRYDEIGATLTKDYIDHLTELIDTKSFTVIDFISIVNEIEILSTNYYNNNNNTK